MTLQREAAHASPRELLARYHRAMRDLSADALADLYAVDAIHEFPLLAPGRPPRYLGREEIRAGYAAAWGAARVRVDEIREVLVHETSDPEVIVAEQTVAATNMANGRPFTMRPLLVIQTRDGLLVHVRDYMDALGSAWALGRLPALVTALEATEPRAPA
jgi:ketosteroid isomerase-like protein